MSSCRLYAGCRVVRKQVAPTTYTAEIYRDADDAHWESNPYAVTIETKTFKKGDVFTIRLASGGGFGAIFTKNEE